MKLMTFKKKYFLGSIFAAFFFPLSLFAQKNSCIECHRELEDKLRAPVEAFKLDVHQKFGLNCSDCHGGNSAKEDIDSAKDKTFKGAPKRSQIPEFCASCHANSAYMKNFNPRLRVDQLSLYWTSRHGQLLRKGDTKVAVCTDCHGVHGILASINPKSSTFPWNIPQTCGRCHADKDYMKPYKIPTSQLEDYKQSVHASSLFEKKNLSAPACNGCHGNHGASPPEASSIAFVCRQCHSSTAELFSKSPHKKAFDEMGISECEACHGNHKILAPSDSMLGTQENAVCIQCHEAGSKPYQLASRIKAKLDEFLSRIGDVENSLDKADRRGVDVSDPRFKLREAQTSLILVRNITHSLDLSEIEKKIEEGEGVVSEVKAKAEAALKEARFRKSGLIIATFFILLLAIAIFLKIKQIEKKSRS
jgi:predicted CXXCH cytochrome family protein